MNKGQWSLRLSLIPLFVIMTITIACTKEKKVKSDDLNHAIVARTTDSPNLATQVEQTENQVKIMPQNLPQDTKTVTCQVNETAVVDCRQGFILNKPSDGKYLFSMKVETNSGEVFTLNQAFVVRDGNWQEDHQSSDAPKDLTLSLDPVNEFVNHDALNRHKPVIIKLSLTSAGSCKVKLTCSRSEGIWSLCNQNNTMDLSLDPREIITGYQKMSVKAQCLDSEVVSNTLDLSWFGVDDNYQPMSLVRRQLPGLSHFQLAKQTDCLNKVFFECRDGKNAEFKRCPNVKTQMTQDFGIRAVCDNGREKTPGPEWVEK